MHRPILYVLLVFSLVAAAVSARVSPQPVQAASGCQFLSAPAGDTAAFCDTFDAPSGGGTRSGALDGLVWGVSRTSQDLTGLQADGFAPTSMSLCGQTVTVMAPNDIAICNGQVVDALNDHGTWADIAMYPKQPFDIAGRTGTVVFDVSNNTQGIHAAWPNFWYTDQPVPAPQQTATTQQASPRNGFGFSMAALCGAGSWCGNNCPYPSSRGFTVDSMFMSTDYVMSNLNFAKMGCVQASTDPTQLNHIEIRISQSAVSVYGTDAGSSKLVLIAQASGLNLPLTRGLIWMEDDHYNANKFNSQGTNTFGWDNVGFDGPVLPQDRTFDVLDSLSSSYNLKNLGWRPGTGGATLSTLPIPGATLSLAHAALLTLSDFPTGTGPLTYALNGHAAHTLNWPFPDVHTYVWRTIAIPLAISEVQTGVNTIRLTAGDGTTVIANVDIVLPGAGGGPVGGPPPVPTASTVPATSTGVPATSTGVPATSTGVPATSTGVPASATPAPTNQVPTSTPPAGSATSTSVPASPTGTPGIGGSATLTGWVAPSDGPVNLTAMGPADWDHVGRSRDSIGVDRMRTANPQISSVLEVMAPGMVAEPGVSSPRTYSWTNGTLSPSMTTSSDVLLSGQGSSFSLSVPADANTRTLRVYVGVVQAQGTLSAQFSDGKGPRYIDSTVQSQSGSSNAEYTLTFKGTGADGQRLLVTWAMARSFHEGKLSLQAAALSANSIVPPVSVSTPVPPAATNTSVPAPPAATNTKTPVSPVATGTKTPVPPVAKSTAALPTKTPTPKPHKK